MLYVGTQLASSLMMYAPTMDKTQRKMMLCMPLIFVLFVIRFPAGVIVYWITTNTWTMGQQYIVRRRLGPMRAAAAVAADGGSAATIVSSTRDKPAPRSANGNAKGGRGAKGGGPTGNGLAGGAGELGGLMARIRPPEEPPAVSTPAARGGPPPRSPRKKKKRSGRRR